METYSERADRLEAACMRAAAAHPNDYKARNEAMERICWRPWFAWRPVRMTDQYTGGGVIRGKWKWLTWVKRHNLNQEYFKED
jgi:hypothetical protein